MVSLLKQWGYAVFYKVLSTRTQGLPQRRPRCYTVAFRNTVKKLQWPPEIEAVPLTHLLQQQPEPGRVLSAVARKRMELRIQQARRQLGRRRLAKAEEAVVDVGEAAQWWSYPTVDAVRACSAVTTAATTS